MHVCFLDIDGTLVLTGGAGQAAFAQTLAEDFAIADIDARVPFAGRSDRAIAMDLFRSHGIEPSAENFQRFCNGYLKRLETTLAANTGSVLPGVTQLLQRLADRGDVALGLLTGNLREGARRKLGYYGLWHWFPFGGFGDEYDDRCHIAAAALAAARSHVDGKSPSGISGRLVVIGDTIHDIECGRSIGARCVAVATGHTSPDVLRKGQPDLLVENLTNSQPVLDLFGD
jgi:phosphoglycolate phosphatase-like HAD superfamily hydrolase